jgi:hypothetical protein
MERGKLESAALFLTILGAMLIMPPLALLFQIERRFLGVPAEVIYLFVVWAGMIFGAWWLGRHLPRDRESETPEDDG